MLITIVIKMIDITFYHKHVNNEKLLGKMCFMVTIFLNVKGSKLKNILLGFNVIFRILRKSVNK